MSDMQPGKGLAISIGGIRWHILFTWAAVDKIQDHFQLPLSSVMKMLSDPIQIFKAAGGILTYLIEDDLRRNNSTIDPPTVDQVMRVIDISRTQEVVEAIIRAYRCDFPEPDEDDEIEDDDQEIEEINIPRLLLIATTELHLSEGRFWEATPRKYFRLVEEYQTMKGLKKSGAGIDDLP